MERTTSLDTCCGNGQSGRSDCVISTVRRPPILARDKLVQLLRIQNGRLLRVLGTPRAASDLWFAAACVEIEEPANRFPLRDFIDSKLKVNGNLISLKNHKAYG